MASIPLILYCAHWGTSEACFQIAGPFASTNVAIGIEVLANSFSCREIGDTVDLDRICERVVCMREVMMLRGAWWSIVALLFAYGCAPTIVGGDASTDRGADALDASLGTDSRSTTDVTLLRCASDRECSALGYVCNTTTARCVECNVASDCGADRACLGNHCITPVRCTTSRMCPGQVCSASLGYCVDCTTDVDCTGGQVCRESACVAPPRMCRSSRECSDVGQVCDATRNICVDCAADTDCPADRYCGSGGTCLPHSCVPGETSCVNSTRVRACDVHGSAWRESDCPSGQTCLAGRCQTLACTPGQMSCDPMTFERRRCNDDGVGFTAMPCATMDACRDGMCVMRACTPGTATCSSSTERRLCAADGLSTAVIACASNEGCRDGACVLRTCVPGVATCSSTTVRSVCNADGFGATSTPCGASQRCAAGVCVDLACVPGASTCVDSRTVRVCAADGSGTSTMTCPASSTCTGTTCSGWVCTPGMATCPAGATTRTICNADGLGTRMEPCVAPSNASMSRCGDGGVCAYTCNAGFGDCDGNTANGCESTLASDSRNCGACGRACAAGAACLAGVCGCPTGQTMCGTACVNTMTDPANCGRCGSSCASGVACSGGACGGARTTCASGFSGSGGNGNSGSVCLRTYTFNVIAGHSYTISTCAGFSGDPYLRVTGACTCANDDSCGHGSTCTCRATTTGTATICASSYLDQFATWNYEVTSTDGGC